MEAHLGLFCPVPLLFRCPQAVLSEGSPARGQGSAVFWQLGLGGSRSSCQEHEIPRAVCWVPAQAGVCRGHGPGTATHQTAAQKCLCMRGSQGWRVSSPVQACPGVSSHVQPCPGCVHPCPGCVQPCPAMSSCVLAVSRLCPGPGCVQAVPSHVQAVSICVQPCPPMSRLCPGPGCVQPFPALSSHVLAVSSSVLAVSSRVQLCPGCVQLCPALSRLCCCWAQPQAGSVLPGSPGTVLPVKLQDLAASAVSVSARLGQDR